MSQQPLVSIVVPVYNAESTLRRCIASLLEQTLDSLEIILVDDGSIDSSGKLCQRYAAEYPQITALHQENRGLTEARRIGTHACRGRFVAYVDSDDTVEPTYAAALSEVLLATGAQLAICAYRVVTEDRRTDRLLPYSTSTVDNTDPSQYIFPLIGHQQESNNINLPGFMCIRMFRKALIHDGLFHSERRYFAEDVVFNLLYSDSVSLIGVVNEPLYNYRQHATSLTNSYRPNKHQMLRRLTVFRQTFLHARGWTEAAQDRLDLSWLAYLFESLDNETRVGYAQFISVAKELRDDRQLTAAVQRLRHKKISPMQAAMLRLFMQRRYRAIYALRWLRRRI